MEELKSLLSNLRKLNEGIKLNETKNNDKLVIFLGALLEILSSKNVFRKNSEVAEFLLVNFSLEFAEYCKRSRPLMLGKTAKFFCTETNNYDLNECLNALYSFIEKVISNKSDDITWTDVIKTMKL